MTESSTALDRGAATRTAWPLVTALIPAYNAEATLVRALDSVFAQDYPALEVVVVDDGSRDATSDVAASYGGGAIRLFSMSKNGGVCRASNHGLSEARGDYVAFLDADDEWLPGKLRKQVAVLEANPKAVFATCGCRFVDRTGAVFRAFGGQAPPGLAKDQIWRALLAATSIAKPSVLARRAALTKVGRFDPDLAVAEDQDLWIRLAMSGEVEWIEEYLVNAHDTPDSLTKVYARRVADFVLPVVLKHVAAKRHELSDAEIRDILGQRYSSMGRNLYVQGMSWRGISFLAKAIANGHRPRENLWYIITATRSANALKRAVGAAPPAAAEPKAPPRGHDLFAPTPADHVSLPDGPPILSVVVDAEAEFDWNGPFLRSLTSVKNLRHQERVQRLFERYRIKPIYMVAYAVAAQAEGYGPLLDFHKSAACEIGAHLQPWENPPFDEELSEHNSLVCNLPAWLHKEKLRQLTDRIEESFGLRPTAHKAGRYGAALASGHILDSLGYRMDLSVLPAVDMSPIQGPNYFLSPARPYWFGPDKRLLELPMTAAFVGLLSRGWPWFARNASRPLLRRLHATGALARAGLLDRITLTPEGITLDEMKRLTTALIQRKHRVFSLSYHSSSLMAGNTPYVRNARDLEAFIAKIEAYLEFFFGMLGGTTMSASELLTLARDHRPGRT